MLLTVGRFSSNTASTLGFLLVDKVFECYTLEDEHRDKKVMSETRIPKGVYNIGFRKVGGSHSRYSKKFGSNHFGMLEVQNVPNFKYILIHIGNDEDDTAGCLLVGNYINNNKIKAGKLSESTLAYKSLYKKVSDALIRGEKVEIEYLDLDKPLTK